mmetsp:Transcript_28934/g.72678  ORF Transcript_28934/g.72678 Transcript_28934/m.72678 type:complete len:132 (-) Transcript_28934:161-556(-)
MGLSRDQQPESRFVGELCSTKLSFKEFEFVQAYFVFRFVLDTVPARGRTSRNELHRSSRTQDATALYSACHAFYLPQAWQPYTSLSCVAELLMFLYSGMLVEHEWQSNHSQSTFAAGICNPARRLVKPEGT